MSDVITVHTYSIHFPTNKIINRMNSQYITHSCVNISTPSNVNYYKKGNQFVLAANNQMVILIAAFHTHLHIAVAVNLTNKIAFLTPN